MKIPACALKSFVLIFLATVIGSTVSWSGESSGNSNGGDRPKFEDKSAWFLGLQKTIRVCIDKSADFGVSDEFSRKVVVASFDTWKRYATERGYFAKPDPTSSPSRSRFPVVFDHSLLDRCDGTEDLKIYMGGAMLRLRKLGKCMPTRSHFLIGVPMTRKRAGDVVLFGSPLLIPAQDLKELEIGTADGL